MLLCIVMCSALLTGCEANPRESSYQRDERIGNTTHVSAEYSVDEYNTYVYTDQPSLTDEGEQMGLSELKSNLTICPQAISDKCREQISGFVHAWLQYGFTYTEINDFEQMSEYVTNDLFLMLSQGGLLDGKLAEIRKWHVVSDIGSIFYYDQYYREYVTQDGAEFFRVKAEIVARTSGDDGYYVDNQYLNRGDVCYEMYFYFLNTNDLPIYGVYEVTTGRQGKCWYTKEGIIRDDSGVVSDEFSSLFGEYEYVKSNVTLPTSEKNQLHGRIIEFINAFFIPNDSDLQTLSDGSVDSAIRERYKAFTAAIQDRRIVYDQNYISYSLEMAFPDISFYENNGQTYYVAKESVMLNAESGIAQNDGLNFIEDGLWKYTIYLVIYSDDPDYRIIQLEILPASGPYESVGDLDEG